MTLTTPGRRTTAARDGATTPHALRTPPPRLSGRTALIGAAIGVAVVAALVAIDVFAPHLFCARLPNRLQDGLTL